MPAVRREVGMTPHVFATDQVKGGMAKRSAAMPVRGRLCDALVYT